MTRLTEAARRILAYRSHQSGCDIDYTDFCTCGMKEAADELRAAVVVEETTPK